METDSMGRRARRAVSLPCDQPADHAMSFLEALGQDDPVAHYVAADKAVAGYVTKIETAGPPADGDSYPNAQKAKAALLEGHSAAVGWVSDIATRCKSLPGTVTNWDPELKSLVANLKLQAKAPLTDAAKKMIALDAPQIVAILSRDAGAFSGLATGLKNLADSLSKAQGDIAGSYNAVWTDWNGYNVAIGNLFGALQGEENKACPSRSTIASLQQQINQQRGYRDAANDWLGVLSGVIAAARDALPAVHYLQSFWQGIGEAVAQANAAAKKMPQDPAAALSIDLAAIEKTWAGLQQQMGEISQQLG